MTTELTRDQQWFIDFLKDWPHEDVPAMTVARYYTSFRGWNQGGKNAHGGGYSTITKVFRQLNDMRLVMRLGRQREDLRYRLMKHSSVEC